MLLCIVDTIDFLLTSLYPLVVEFYPVSSIGSTSDVDSNPSRPETRTIKKENRESIHSNSSSLL